MNDRSEHRKIDWTPEDRARHKAIRERFQRERPTLEELVASGEYCEPIPHGAYLDFRLAMHALKTERERRGLSLADVAERSGIDAAKLGELENGKQPNTTLHTLFWYLDALGKQLVWTFEDVTTPETDNNSLPPQAAQERIKKT